MVLPDTELPRWVVKDGLAKEVKDAVVGRLDGKLKGYPHRQDLVDSYLKLNKRMGRLGRVSYSLRDLLIRLIENKVYRHGNYNPSKGDINFSIILNDRRYLYLTQERKFIVPWDIKELSL